MGKEKYMPLLSAAVTCHLFAPSSSDTELRCVCQTDLPC